ncbi:MAG: NADH-quinone oxidoreductase subunit C [Actinomycetes bacterium]|jgi:NADH:ubiquinone oxidoreductase subunit C|nr:NADH-quinone oxidoreductase subunit C [Actinomycetes bacterium]
MMIRTDHTLLQTALDAAGVSAAEITDHPQLGTLVVLADSGMTPTALAALKAAGFEQLIDTFGADIDGQVQATYRLRSLSLNVDVTLRTQLDYGATLRSVTDSYASALLAERELCEMFGLTLTGHPNPKRLLTIDGAPPFLRKEVGLRTKEELWQNS